MLQSSINTVSRPQSGSIQPHLSSQLLARQKQKELLGNQITELAAHIHAATFRLLELIREFDACEGWAGEGVLSCAHWMLPAVLSGLPADCGVAVSTIGEHTPNSPGSSC